MNRLSRRDTLAGAAATALLAPTALAQNNRNRRSDVMPDLILVNAKITTLDRENPQAVAIRDGRFRAVGSEQDVRAAATRA